VSVPDVRAVTDDDRPWLRDLVDRLWLITTNDNVAAIRFYQRRGLELCQLHRNFVDTVRAAKPQISGAATDGIPFRHALEFSS
jgi:hypothetical protein